MKYSPRAVGDAQRSLGFVGKAFEGGKGDQEGAGGFVKASGGSRSGIFELPLN